MDEQIFSLIQDLILPVAILAVAAIRLWTVGVQGRIEDLQEQNSWLKEQLERGALLITPPVRADNHRVE